MWVLWEGGDGDGWPGAEMMGSNDKVWGFSYHCKINGSTKHAD